MDWWTNQLLNPNPAFFKLPKFHLDTEHKFLNFFIHSTMYNWIQPNSPTMHPNSIKSIKRKAWKLLTFYFFFYKNFQNLANSQPNSNWNNFRGQNWGMSSIYQVITTLRIVSNSDNNKRKLYSNPKRKPQNFQLIFKRHPQIWNPANLHLHGQMKVIWIIKITHIRHESNHNGLKLPYKIQHTIKTQKVNTKIQKTRLQNNNYFFPNKATPDFESHQAPPSRSNEWYPSHQGQSQWARHKLPYQIQKTITTVETHLHIHRRKKKPRGKKKQIKTEREGDL